MKVKFIKTNLSRKENCKKCCKGLCTEKCFNVDCPQVPTDNSKKQSGHFKEVEGGDKND